MSRYWERRYARGGTSGRGSQGWRAREKADYVNALVERESIASVIDWGCGDGEQAALFSCPSYLGLDPSPTAVARARKRCPDKRFALLREAGDYEQAELALSFDVLYHLLDQVDFDAHLARIFSATRFALVRGTDIDRSAQRHVRRRAWTHLVPDGWRFVERPEDPSVNGLYLLAR